VLVNILTNAVQAIGENGRIVLRTVTGEDDVLLVVEDNGVGIAEEHLDRLFDPFYTTKEVGEGTGLGLSISYGLIRKHFGSISIDSTPAVGTKVTVRLPVAAHAACC
jgi:two-component system NtrC family sensor kinase